MKKTVFFRADADTSIGLGHFSRCIALAQMIKPMFNCVFFMRNYNTDIVAQILKCEFDFLAIKSESFLDEIDFMLSVEQQPIAIVVDGYQFNEVYFKTLKSLGTKTIYIDDFGYSNPYIDVIINHALNLSDSSYTDFGQKLCLGEKYAILRPAFLALAKQSKSLLKCDKIFICFGGADTFNLTLKALSAFDFEHDFTIEVVLASTFPHKKSIIYFSKSATFKVNIHYSLAEKDMALLMGSCQLAIAPTSSLSYEICAAKMIYIGGYYVDNQKKIHDGFLQQGCLYSMGDFANCTAKEFQLAVKHVLKNIELSQTMVENQKKVISGFSDLNLLDIFKGII